MTKIFYREYYDRFLIIVEGHSNYKNFGEDIVCSAVSILVYTLLNTLKDEEIYKHLKIKKEVLNDGYFCLEVEPFDYAKSRVDAVFNTVMIGFTLLNENYPNNVRLE